MTEEEGQVAPWYRPLEPSWNPLTFRFQMNWLGSSMIQVMLVVLEALHLAPKGSRKVQAMLQEAAWGLAQGGRDGLFTPMLLLVARKPEA
jgi:sterol 24-C-methyltransferase